MNIKEYSNALETLSNIGIKKYEKNCKSWN
ncbi:MAG: hypothetical protein H6613_15925 [Ignavibacteriales bacterium]|nr:hypothetical protein [Ignavibacteriales bacterium]